MGVNIFYKYKSFTNDDGNDISEYTFDSLINKYFYFSRPKELNDPEDCKVLNEYEAEDSEIQKWIDRSPSDSKRHSLTVDAIRDKMKNGIFQEYMENAARQDEQHFHVLSLTDNWQSIHMWEKYAHNFEGICIGYNFTFCDEHNYNYIEGESLSANIPIIESFRPVNGKPYFELQKVLYDNDGTHKYNIFKSNDEANKKNIEYALFHKTEKWREENEYRKIIMDTLTRQDSVDLRVFYPDSVLGEINFGYRCNTELQQQIIEYVKCYYSNWKDIHFYRVQKTASDSSVERVFLSIS